MSQVQPSVRSNGYYILIRHNTYREEKLAITTLEKSKS